MAFIRSIAIQQTEPWLQPLSEVFRRDGIEAALFFTDGECTERDFPGKAIRLPPGASHLEIAQRVVNWGADSAVSLSIPDENAIRDSLAMGALADRGIATVMHPVDTTSLLANKWETRIAVAASGIDVPAGSFVDGDLLNGRAIAIPAYRDVIGQKVDEIGFPLLVKPLWDCLGNGIRFIGGLADWRAFAAAPFDGNAVLEKCLDGELCSVEIVGCDGSYLFQPLVWKGPTGGPPSFAFEQVRYSAPRLEADVSFIGVAELLRQLCANLRVNGSIEVEMIYRDGRFYVIEINPRVSGTTGLSVVASGVNTYLCLVRMAQNGWSATLPTASRRRLAIQFPFRADKKIPDAMHNIVEIVRASTFTIDGAQYANMTVGCEYGRVDAFSRYLASSVECLVNDVRESVREVVMGCARHIDAIHERDARRYEVARG